MIVLFSSHFFTQPDIKFQLQDYAAKMVSFTASVQELQQFKEVATRQRTALDEYVEELQGVMKEKDDALRSQGNELREKEETLTEFKSSENSLKRSLKAGKDLISNLQAQLDECRQSEASLQADVAELKSSLEKEARRMAMLQTRPTSSHDGPSRGSSTQTGSATATGAGAASSDPALSTVGDSEAMGGVTQGKEGDWSAGPSGCGRGPHDRGGDINPEETEEERLK